MFKSERMSHCRYFVRSLILVISGILTAEISFSNGCHKTDFRREEVCYSAGSGTERTWNDAQQECQDKNYSLPILQNIEEQAAIEAYLVEQLNSKALRTNAVWTAGKRKTYNDWTWINGQRLGNAITISNDGYSAEKTHMLINCQNTGTGNILKPEYPLALNWYLCQFKDRQCNGRKHEVNATNGCLIPSGYGNESWYGARNECLSKGGDLAILTDQDLQILKNHRFPNYNYWIGLRRINWVWQTNSQASPEEVKYTKWAKEEMSTDGEELCISIATNDGQWRSLRCNHTMLSTVCEKRTLTTAGPTSRKSTTCTANTAVTTADTINNHNDESSFSSVTGPAAIGAGIVIIILCIVVILVVIWRKSKSSMKTSNRRDNEVGNEQYQELHRSQTQTNASDIYTELTPRPENPFVSTSNEATEEQYQELHRITAYVNETDNYTELRTLKPK